MAEPDAQVQVEIAIFERLAVGADYVSTDPELAALLPGGLYSRQAPDVDLLYLTLSLVAMDVRNTYAGPYWYRFTYRFIVSEQSESIDAASAALHRINVLLQDATPTMEDFDWQFSRRLRRVEVPLARDGITYQRLADEYRVEVSPK
jgi:hypothetical protein